MKWIKGKLDQLGVLGSLLAGLCCIGTPVLIVLISSLGLGFLIHDAILIPLLLIFLGINMMGQALSIEVHGNKLPFIISVISSVFVFGGIWFSVYLVYIGFIAMIGASVWNAFLKKQCCK